MEEGARLLRILVIRVLALERCLKTRVFIVGGGGRGGRDRQS